MILQFVTYVHNHDLSESFFGHLGEVSLQLLDLFVAEAFGVGRLDHGGRGQGVVLGALDVLPPKVSFFSWVPNAEAKCAGLSLIK